MALGCNRCGSTTNKKYDNTICCKCNNFIQTYGNKFYTGEIQAGDMFDGHDGFTWDRVGVGTIQLYNIGDYKVTEMTIHEFRCRATNRKRNHTGRLLFKKIK